MVNYQTENVNKTFELRCGYRHTLYVEPHIHEHSEIVYIHSGTMTMYLNGKKLTVPEGHAVFVFPNQIHQYTKETESDSWLAVFSNDFLAPFFRLHFDTVPLSPILDMRGGEQIIEALENTDTSDICRITGLLHLLYSRLEKNTEFEKAPINGEPVYNAALNYLKNNYKNDITLSDMSKALGYHEKYLSSALHSLTKMNFRTFLASYRVDNAQKLLKTTGMNISRIALESGFSSINTFNRVFKQITGLTPREYKNRT